MDIWYLNPIATFSDVDTLLEFIPNKSMSLTEQLNAMMRFVIYFALIMFVVRKDINIAFLIIIVGLLTLVIHKNETGGNAMKDTIMEHLNLHANADNELAIKPTKDNPFMNFSFEDHVNFPSRPPAQDPLNSKVQDEIELAFNDNQLRDVDDIFKRNQSSRQFYTMPCTTVVNDRESFLKANFNLPKTRKESSIENWSSLKSECMY